MAFRRITSRSFTVQNLDVLSPNHRQYRAADASETGLVCCAAKLIEANAIQSHVCLSAYWGFQ